MEEIQQYEGAEDAEVDEGGGHETRLQHGSAYNMYMSLQKLSLQGFVLVLHPSRMPRVRSSILTFWSKPS